MNRKKSRFLFAAVSVVTLLMVSACGMLTEGLEKGYNLVLTVQGQSPGRAVTVDYYDVTRLEIEVRRTKEGEILELFHWTPGGPDDRFVVALGDTGEYFLKVTHFYQDGEVEKPAEEWATFKIKKYIITMINIIPGAVGAIDIEPPSEDSGSGLDGRWFGSTLGYDDEPWFVDAYVELGPGSKFVSMLYEVGSSAPENLVNFSMIGTYEPIDGTFVIDVEMIYYDGQWVYQQPGDYFDDIPATPYSLAGDVLTLHQDMVDYDGIPETDWPLIRQTEPITPDPLGPWYGYNVIVPVDNFVNSRLILNSDMTYELLMVTDDPRYLPDPIIDPEEMSSFGTYTDDGSQLVLTIEQIYFDPNYSYPSQPEWSEYPPLPGWTIPYNVYNDILYLEAIDFGGDGSYVKGWVLSR